MHEKHLAEWRTAIGSRSSKQTLDLCVALLEQWLLEDEQGEDSLDRTPSTVVPMDTTPATAAPSAPSTGCADTPASASGGLVLSAVRHSHHDAIYQYTEHLIRHSRVSWFLVDCMLGIVHDVRTSPHGYKLCVSNFVVLATTALMLSYKLHEDVRLKLSFWCRVSNLPAAYLIDAEQRVLRCLNWNLLSNCERSILLDAIRASPLPSPSEETSSVPGPAPATSSTTMPPLSVRPPTVPPAPDAPVVSAPTSAFTRVR